jgi:hypothetical protein
MLKICKHTVLPPASSARSGQESCCTHRVAAYEPSRFLQHRCVALQRMHHVMCGSSYGWSSSSNSSMRISVTSSAAPIVQAAYPRCYCQHCHSARSTVHALAQQVQPAIRCANVALSRVSTSKLGMCVIVANIMEQCSLFLPLQRGAGPMALMLWLDWVT